MRTRFPWVLVWMAACTGPAEFDRANPADPQSTTYQVAQPGQLTVYPYVQHPRLAWVIPSILPEIIVERQVNNGPWVAIDTVAATETPWVDESVTLYAPLSLRYRIRAEKSGQVSETVTSWEVVVQPNPVFNLRRVVLPDPFHIFRDQPGLLASELSDGVLRVTVRLDTVAVERRVDGGAYEMVYPTLVAPSFHDIGQTAKTLQYRFTPRYMGAAQRAPVETAVFERRMQMDAQSTVFTTEEDREIGLMDSWTPYHLVGGEWVRLASVRATTNLMRVRLIRPDGTQRSLHGVGASTMGQAPELFSTRAAIAADGSRFAIRETQRRFSHMPLTSSPTAIVHILPSHQVWTHIRYADDGSALWVGFTDNVANLHEIRQLTHSDESWSTILTTPRMVEWFDVDVAADRVHVIEVSGGAQTWVTRRLSDQEILFSRDLEARARTIRRIGGTYLLLSGAFSGTRYWIADPGAARVDAIPLGDSHGYMVHAPTPGQMLRLVGQRLHWIDLQGNDLRPGDWFFTTPPNAWLMVDGNGAPVMIQFNRTVRYEVSESRYEVRTTP